MSGPITDQEEQDLLMLHRVLSDFAQSNQITVPQLVGLLEMWKVTVLNPKVIEKRNT